MTKISYSGYRFPPEIIHQAIWLYLRFTLSFRDVEDLLAERGIAISYETIRRWVNHFGPIIAAELFPAQEWIDLSIVQRGQFDEVRRADGSIAYRDVRIEAAEIRREWRPETVAMKTVRERRAIEKACLRALIERMRETPNGPVGIVTALRACGVLGGRVAACG